MIRQVRMKEVYLDASGALISRDQPVFAFGTHPNVSSVDEAHPVTSAKAVDNKLRIIMDELLVGNYLEEIACRGQVDEDSYDLVPPGTTPDDVARCAVAKDVLPASCPGDFAKAVCICKLDTGCGETPKGGPVGVLDANQDGAADDTRFQRGAVGLKCGSIDVPIDINMSYWNPSGDQNVPAKGGFDALGPAIVLATAAPPGGPMGMPAFLPTNTTCGLVFAPSVVDKQGNQVCAPVGGDIDTECSPGDTSAFSFKVEALSVRDPFVDGNTGISRTDPVDLKFSAPLAPTTINNVTVTQGATAFTGFTVSQTFSDTIRLTWTGAGLAANQQYTITIPVTVTDFFAQPTPMPTTFTFTTGS